MAQTLDGEREDSMILITHDYKKMTKMSFWF